jgi:hypothetical protein
VEAGLVRHIGVSNFSAKKIGELIPHCKIKIEVNQIERHPLLQQNALVAYCASQGIHITAYAPLGSSDRPAFVKAPDAPVLLDNPVIRSIAEARGRTPAQVLIAWQVGDPLSARRQSCRWRPCAHGGRAATDRKPRSGISYDCRRFLGGPRNALDAPNHLGRSLIETASREEFLGAPAVKGSESLRCRLRRLIRA